MSAKVLARMQETLSKLVEDYGSITSIVVLLNAAFVMSRDLFDCQNWGMLVASSGWRPGMLLNSKQCTALPIKR